MLAVWDQSGTSLGPCKQSPLCAGNGSQATTSDSQWRGDKGGGQDAMALVVHYFGRLTHDRLAHSQTDSHTLSFSRRQRGASWIMDHPRRIHLHTLHIAHLHIVATSWIVTAAAAFAR
jgi:hypothetical protein